MKAVTSRSLADLDGIVITSEDDFEVITMYGKPQTYPNLSSGSSNMLPYPVHPNIPYQTNTVTTYQTNALLSQSSLPLSREPSHPLEGVPFKLSPRLEMSSTTQDAVLEDVRKTLERVKNLLNSADFTYDCTLERNFLREHGDK